MARRRTGFQKKIDTVHWTYGSFATGSLGTGSIVGELVLAAQHLPETLLRIRGEWAARLEGLQPSSVGASVSAGLILVPEGTGATVLWSPITDGDAPWIWWDTFNLMYEEYVSDATWSSQTSDGRRVIDSKAMRKVRNTELQAVVENAPIPGSTGVSCGFAGAVRVLSGS